MTGRMLEALQEILSGQAQHREEAEASIAEQFETAPEDAAIGSLEIVAEPGNEDAVRQLAAVLFRRNCFSVMNDDATFWKHCSAETRELLKDRLLGMLKEWNEEENYKLSHRICDCIGAVVKSITLEFSEILEEQGHDTDDFVLPPAMEYWPELMATLWELTQSGNPARLEAALYIYSSIPGIFGKDVGQYQGPIYELLEQGLKHDNLEVSVSAANALAGLIGRMEKEEALPFAELLTPCVHVVAVALTNERNTDAERVLQALVDLTETQPKLFRPQITEITHDMVQLAGNEEFYDDCRRLALEVCVGLCETAGSMMRRIDGFTESIFPVCINMIKEVADDDEWSTVDDQFTEEDENVLCGEVALDRLARHLGGKIMVPIAFSFLPAMLGAPGEEHWKDRYAACIAIASIGEGCYTAMRPSLRDILNHIMPLLEDENFRVRYAAINVAGQLAVDFAPKKKKEYKSSFAFAFRHEIIPALQAVMAASEGHPRVQAHATAALVNVLENIRADDLKEFTSGLLDCVEYLFSQEFNIVREAGVTVLSTVADLCADQFQDYYEKFMPAMFQIIQSCTTPDSKVLMGKTFEASTLIGLAVGKEMFLEDAKNLMTYMIEHEVRNLADDAPHTNYLHTSFARVCQILQDDFYEFLPEIFEPLLRSASLPSGLVELQEGESIDDLPEGVEAWQLLDIADQRFAIKTSTVDEKRAANHMLLIYCQHLGGKFASRVEEVMPLALKNLGYYFEENIRVSAATIIADLIHSYVENEEYGMDAAVKLWNSIYPEFISQTSKEPDLEVMVAKLSGIGRCMLELEADSLSEGFLTQLFTLLKKIFEEYDVRALERFKQRIEDEDYDEEAEVALTEEEEYDNDVMGEVSDLLHLALSYGKADVKQYFDGIVENVVSLLSENRQPLDLKWGISIFDDVVEHLGPISIEYSDHFVESLVSNITHQNEEVRQACAYGIGVMAGVEGDPFSQFCVTAIESLLNVIDADESREELNVDATENAISAYVKIGRNPVHGLDETEVLNRLLEWLPVTEDYDEATYLYQWILDLLNNEDPRVCSGENLNAIVRAFTAVIGTAVMPCKDDVCKGATAFLQSISQSESEAADVLNKQLEDDDVRGRLEASFMHLNEDSES